uniref:trypsin n=1 Tax=Anopheles quadriannulatus TaxID=34691 RepID=A0A1Y9J0Q0_ANOQN
MQISATVFILVLVLGHREEVSGATIADRLSPMALIIGGTDVEDGKAPYLAGLVYNNSETYCGGSIIARDYFNRYSAITFRNDVALLRLKTPIKFEEHVEKIELNEELVPINATLTIVGWGFVGWNKENPKRTQVIKVQHIGLNRCRKMSNGSAIYPEHLCTFSRAGHGPCKGDSGSPVVWKGKQVGVVSWAMAGVCAIGLPDVQASIRYFYGWITKTMAANSGH